MHSAGSSIYIQRVSQHELPYHQSLARAGLHSLASSMRSMKPIGSATSQTRSLCHSSTEPHVKTAPWNVRIQAAITIDSLVDAPNKRTFAALAVLAREVLFLTFSAADIDAFFILTSSDGMTRVGALYAKHPTYRGTEARGKTPLQMQAAQYRDANQFPLP